MYNENANFFFARCAARALAAQDIPGHSKRRTGRRPLPIDALGQNEDNFLCVLRRRHRAILAAHELNTAPPAASASRVLAAGHVTANFSFARVTKICITA
jgi:hypothetical protein